MSCEEVKRSGILFVISAPSGTGKSTLTRLLLKHITGMEYSVSMTTREQRPGEQDGIDYEYTDEATFRRYIAQGEFIEHASVHGNMYGTRKTTVERALHRGVDILLDIDIQGAQTIRNRIDSGQLSLKAIFVFIMPPSMKALEARLRSRSTESEEAICRRLKNAEAEMRCAKDYDYVLVNDDVEAAAARLEEIVDVERTRQMGLAIARTMNKA